MHNRVGCWGCSHWYICILRRQISDAIDSTNILSNDIDDDLKGNTDDVWDAISKACADYEELKFDDESGDEGE